MDETNTRLIKRRNEKCLMRGQDWNMGVKSLIVQGIVTLLLALPLGFASVAVQASVLTINGADNRIELEGELSATVTHTAEGMAIEIPGVEITLDCEGSVETEACTVAINVAQATNAQGGAASGGSASDSSGGDSSAGTGTTGTVGDDTTSTGGSSATDSGGSDATGSNDSDDASGDGSDDSSNSGAEAGSLEELCSNPRPTEYNSAQINYDKYCPTYDPNSQGSNTTEPGDGSAGSSTDEEEEECKGPGYDCWWAPGGPGGVAAVSEELDPFPTGSDRVIYDTRYDMGSAGRHGGGNTVYVRVPKGQVAVVDLTMSSSTDISQTVLAFGVTATQPTHPMHSWISRSVDGESISPNCERVGYAETQLKLFTQDAPNRSCQLESGKRYYLMLAFCKTEDGDIQCRSSEAKADVRDVELAAKSAS